MQQMVITALVLPKKLVGSVGSVSSVVVSGAAVVVVTAAFVLGSVVTFAVVSVGSSVDGSVVALVVALVVVAVVASMSCV